MKCENCGNNEVNFNYRANISGKVTEKHLCSECAAKLGYTAPVYYGFNSMFDDFMSDFPMFGRRSVFSPFSHLMAPVMAIPRMFMMPMIDVSVGDNGDAPQAVDTAETAEEKNAQTVKVKVDEKLAKKREINVLRREMNKAAREENYEKAIELRDKLRELEGEDSDK